MNRLLPRLHGVSQPSADHDAGGHGRRPGAGAADNPAGGQPAFAADAQQGLLRPGAVPDGGAGGAVRRTDRRGGDGVGVTYRC